MFEFNSRSFIVFFMSLKRREILASEVNKRKTNRQPSFGMSRIWTTTNYYNRKVLWLQRIRSNDNFNHDKQIGQNEQIFASLTTSHQLTLLAVLPTGDILKFITSTFCHRCLSVYLPVCLSVCLSVCRSVHLVFLFWLCGGHYMDGWLIGWKKKKSTEARYIHYYKLAAA